MILNALTELFDHLEASGEIEYGFSDENIIAAIVFDKNGKFITTMKNTKPVVKNGKTYESVQKMRTPIPVKDDNAIKPSFGFGYSQYLLGFFSVKESSLLNKKEPVILSIFDSKEILDFKFSKINPTALKKEKENLDKAFKRFDSFKLIISKLANCNSTVCKALVSFYENFTSNYNLLSEDDKNLLCQDKIGFICDEQWLFEDAEYKNCYLKYFNNLMDDSDIEDSENAYLGDCLCCGEKNTSISQKHLAITGFPSGLASGNFLITFKEVKKQGNVGADNAPICISCMNKYVRALKYMLDNKNLYMTSIGDLSVFFWSKHNNTILKQIVSDSEDSFEDEEFNSYSPEELIKEIFESAKSSTKVNLELLKTDKFYVLGLAPNGARLSVRFFYENNFDFFYKNISNHYKTFAYSSLKNNKVEYRMAKTWQISKILNKDNHSKEKWIKAILLGGKYPSTLYYQAIVTSYNKCKNNRDKTMEFNKSLSSKLSIISGYHNISKKEEFKLSENKETSTMYNLGRLLALVDANHSRFKYLQSNATFKGKTICERYFSMMLNSPRKGFTLLMETYNKTFSQMNKSSSYIGTAIYFSKKINEILSEVQNIPQISKIDDKAEFILGYYSEINKLKNNNSKEEINNETD